ncbi:hypothetical protein FIBSPDRAFT_872092 [Athelia psychrophila]|uniref:Uncharacterized protein n=1 Tax=Athelia psychrophila TaxID=1759441 RepID=A0A165ZUB8_9AGAM|nr:hypothetical protein FIBSPDRAFT_872092 [Fibularhizoctonia sp. CBS 109695]
MDEATIITKLKKALQTVHTISVFLHKLRVDQITTGIGCCPEWLASRCQRSPRLAFNRAYTSLLGLTRLGIFANNKAGRQAAERLLESWPGEFALTCGG